MRRLVVYLMVGLLALATAMPPQLACAQEPWQEPPPVKIQTRDLTPYMVGFGAIMGMIAFNIAAPSVSAWFGSTVTSVRNVGTALWATQRAVATGAPVSVAAAAAAGPVVQPLTETMMAQAQVMGTAAAIAGAVVVNYVYKLVRWVTGAAP